ncbi:hypothetical protein QBC39DRAFT_382526 [Podospora conica]|nr:hypothetical protein QBC39DRAFT_382526 [Schizothecium conicum]
MEQFLIDNAAHYLKLVSAFKPRPASKTATTTTIPNPDMVVSARIRPLLPDEVAAGFPQCIFPRDNAPTTTVDIHELRKAIRGLPTLTTSTYTIDHLFPATASTPTLYTTLISPLVPWSHSGGVSTLFAYGQTGSGKTHTISGLSRLVAASILRPDRRVHVTIIELAGQSAFDLLNARKPVSVLEDSFGTAQLAGALEHPVSHEADLLAYIDAATALRRTAATDKNDASSRSHSICRLRVENPALPGAEDGVFYLVDLAGSEAARDRAGHDAGRMKEAREINTSLSVLKDCIRGRAMADLEGLGVGVGGGKGYVPFRQSALTKTLKHVFDPAGGRRCKTVVVACVNPCLADAGPGRNTMRFAELLRVVLPKGEESEAVEGVPATWDNKMLRAWVEKNSGTPPLDAALLAPTESGRQLLRLPVPEFLARALLTPGVEPEQAQAVQSKLWGLHVDSQKTLATRTQTTKTKVAGASPEIARLAKLSASADPDRPELPFKERIRPGMVVRTEPKEGHRGGGGGAKSYAMVLSDVVGLGGGVKDMKGREVVAAEGEGKGKRFLCAVVGKAPPPGAYNMHLWMQGVVTVDEMMEEVLLEYDEATRYYYMVV